MAKFEVGLYVVMAILAIGFIISLQQTLKNPTEINLYITIATLVVTAILVAIAILRERR
jgi:nitrate reductase gamma subunit